MGTSPRIAAAGNVLAPALAEIVAAGYIVTADGSQWEASSKAVTLVAPDPLSLLGLVKLYDARGSNWAPSGSEVEALLALDGQAREFSERADVWAGDGAVHLLCVTSEGDPVELTEHEARAFAGRLAEAIKAAS